MSARTLLAKEWSEHRWLALWLALFSALGVVVFRRLTDVQGGVLSYLAIASFYALPVLALIAALLGQRLIAAEYYGRTQQFLEALPVRRLTVPLVKYAVGLVVLSLLAGGVLAYSIVVASHHEFIRWDFVGRMVVRLLTYVFVLWSLVFTVSLLGRLRLPLVALGAFGVWLADLYTDFELIRFAPLALIDSQLFALERDLLPWRDLGISLALGAVLFALGVGLSQLRDGSVVETLASPITGRAKGFLVALAGAAIGIGLYFGPDPEPEPFRLTDPLTLSAGQLRIAYLDEVYLADANALLDYLDERLQAFDELVGSAGDTFLVQISMNPALWPWEYTTLYADTAGGIGLDANFERRDDWDTPLFGAFVFHQVVTARSRGRLLLEPHHWLTDGLTRWWAAHGERLPAALDSTVDPILLEALYLTAERPPGAGTLRFWDRSADDYGESSVMAVAYAAIRVLQEEIGSDGITELAKAFFGRESHRDVRDWWQDRRQPHDEFFETATGIGWDEFNARWIARLDELRTDPAYRRALADIPRGSGGVEATVSLLGGRDLEFAVSFEPPIAADTLCLAIHRRLGLYDLPISRGNLEEEFVRPMPGATATDRVEHTLATTYGAGARVFGAIECKLDAFPQPMVFGPTRLTVP